MRPKPEKRATSQMLPNALNVLKISKFAIVTLYTLDHKYDVINQVKIRVKIEDYDRFYKNRLVFMV